MVGVFLFVCFLIFSTNVNICLTSSLLLIRKILGSHIYFDDFPPFDFFFLLRCQFSFYYLHVIFMSLSFLPFRVIVLFGLLEEFCICFFHLIHQVTCNEIGTAPFHRMHCMSVMFNNHGLPCSSSVFLDSSSSKLANLCLKPQCPHSSHCRPPAPQVVVYLLTVKYAAFASKRETMF